MVAIRVGGRPCGGNGRQVDGVATRVVISVGDEKKLSGWDDMNARLQVVRICKQG